ncbi:TetR/AcrR family transcriptional regulator [Homoserinibacter sp. YIM 151385]|uniref:TetR/AcrR family transcriptional regulator n=1 Tax=Homoserinibacter sp. YIM 151385 TaxID=2985506 RepID=UPI0022F03785|nr:TetR/AcrR family transcriptional regulator [Homoserinibacter sp. YIM 151385]WBU39273.1 TetR family transcriptional regulator [Homoserinibacter sp. YIM 151385]
MPRPSNRDAILDAFAAILDEQGDRPATLDAVAERAGVSKGGLLYHYGSKEQLVAGLVARLDDLVAEDARAIRADPDGPLTAFLRVSVADDSALDRTMTALLRIAQDERYPEALAALRRAERAWRAIVEESIPDDPLLSRMVLLISDGMYFSSLLDVTAAPRVDREDAAAMVAAIETLRAARRG